MKPLSERIGAASIGGLYAITPDEPDTAALARKVHLALRGGARVVQYRNKCAGAALRLEQAQALRGLTREFRALLIVNDDVLLAQQIDADGVHLGATDGNLAEARRTLGGAKYLGASCYNRLELAHAAVAQGADHVAFGSFFASTVKPDAVAATPELLRQAQRELNVPLVAIGGITVQNGAQLIAAGADALAVISALFGAADIEDAARQFSGLGFQ